jgi:hypothetical protein
MEQVEYYLRRAAEEDARAAEARSEPARRAHLELAREYRSIARISPAHRAELGERVARHRFD